jgi:hypothetical protein
MERTSGVAGLKFVAYFARFTNVTYCLSEDLPFGRSFILLRLGVVYSHTERQAWRTGEEAALNWMVRVVEVLVFPLSR